MKTVGFSDILQQNTVIWDFTFLSFKWLQKQTNRKIDETTAIYHNQILQSKGFKIKGKRLVSQ